MSKTLWFWMICIVVLGGISSIISCERLHPVITTTTVIDSGRVVKVDFLKSIQSENRRTTVTLDNGHIYVFSYELTEVPSLVNIVKKEWKEVDRKGNPSTFYVGSGSELSIIAK